MAQHEMYTPQQLRIRMTAEQLAEALEPLGTERALCDRLRGLAARAHTLPTGDWSPMTKPLVIPEVRVIRTDGVE